MGSRRNSSITLQYSPEYFTEYFYFESTILLFALPVTLVAFPEYFWLQTTVKTIRAIEYYSNTLIAAEYLIFTNDYRVTRVYFNKIFVLLRPSEY